MNLLVVKVLRLMEFTSPCLVALSSGILSPGGERGGRGVKLLAAAGGGGLKDQRAAHLGQQGREKLWVGSNDGWGLDCLAESLQLPLCVNISSIWLVRG